MTSTYYSRFYNVVSLRQLTQREMIACSALFFLCAAPGFAQQPNTSSSAAPAWMSTSLSPDARAGLVLREMTLDEKISMVHGAEWEHNIWVNGSAKPALTEMVPGAAGYVPAIKRLQIPAIQMADAALGVTRGAFAGRYSTVLPSALSGASGWDAKMSYEYGALVGRELTDAGFNMSLGGGCNLDREPRNGRNFEYKGEDPILAGTLVGAEIRGIQDQHILGDIKHFALNDQETQRNAVNVIADMRSMRETDLLAFEIGIRDSHPNAVMCSYNKLNGPWACDSPALLGNVLKKDLGFDGFVVSDWKATHSTTNAALAGLDMEMPDGKWLGPALKTAVEAGSVPMARLDDMVRRILRAEFAAGLFEKTSKPKVTDVFGGLVFAQHAAEQGTVLLKNDRQMLPLNTAKLHTVLLIGGHADVGVLAGGGSALVDPPGGSAIPAPTPRDIVYDRSSPLLALQAQLPEVHISYLAGEDIDAAAAAARQADVVLVFGVQPSREDTDLVNLSLPNNQDALIERVVAANPHTVVVLETGSAVTMPWEPKVPAILELWYPGIRGAEALANILLGKVNPSGKLPITFPRSEADLPRPVLTTRTEPNPTVNYLEGLKVGYKWYDAEGKSPLFAFGHGLSYTRFVYSALHVDPRLLTVTFDVENAGGVAGAEVSQVYLSMPTATNEPPKRLVAWQKTELAAGESQHITLKLDPLYLSVFDVPTDAWKTIAGKYTLHVGGSSAQLPLTQSVDLFTK